MARKRSSMAKRGQMGWLIGATIASIVAAFVAVRVVEYFLAGAVGMAAGAVKAAAFSSVWTAVTTSTGMRAFTNRVRGVRTGVDGVSKKIDRRIDRL